ncbi:M50 family metallopeptidase [Nonomuraea angiospora]|uniref:M50 family metallopeptidase n=1 Tax=Nonomuraea angiospora TaxID=46172 RepID=UPI0029ACDF15|nr:M50 family metallopeptidase [Nonomuraea angiospora]MDX3103483.1 M50 family metallopeptidase [Nonomuraea angiospora]
MTVTGDDTSEAAWLEDARPRLRSAVRVGPALARGPATIHYVADAQTRAYFQVGPREAFLMRRLDGARSLADLGAEYAGRFGRRLDAAHWQRLLGLLADRRLLDPAGPDELARMREKAELARRSEGHSALHWRVPIPGAARLVPAVGRRAGWLLHPVLAAPLAVAGLVVCVLVTLNWSALYAEVRPGWGVLAALLAWLMYAVHELAHGVACHRYGGLPTQIGVMWRFPLMAPYCKVDDVVTFPRAWQRVATAFAGVYVNLALLVPLGALWLWGPDGPRPLVAALLLSGATIVLVNLLPVLRLDGYHMLEHATSTADLQGESFRFAAAFLRHGPAGVRAYPRRARWLHASYTLVSVAVLAPVAFLVVRLWFETLAGLWGAKAAVLVLGAEAVLVGVLLRWWVLRRQRRRAERQD